MGLSPRRALRTVPLLLATFALAGIAALLAWDVRPQLFPASAHAVLGSFPLAMIALAWLAYHTPKRASFSEWLKAALLAAAFCFWAANQCLHDAHSATVCNDIAIALFVIDLVWVIAA